MVRELIGVVREVVKLSLPRSVLDVFVPAGDDPEEGRDPQQRLDEHGRWLVPGARRMDPLAPVDQDGRADARTPVRQERHERLPVGVPRDPDDVGDGRSDVDVRDQGVRDHGVPVARAGNRTTNGVLTDSSYGTIFASRRCSPKRNPLSDRKKTRVSRVRSPRDARIEPMSSSSARIARDMAVKR